MYNVLEMLRSGETFTEDDRNIYEAGLVGILRLLHDELDAAVFDAYGWSPSLTTEQILANLVALNAQRHAEEAGGFVRWLRPEFQAPNAAPMQAALGGLAASRACRRHTSASSLGPLPSPTRSVPLRIPFALSLYKHRSRSPAASNPPAVPASRKSLKPSPLLGRPASPQKTGTRCEERFSVSACL